MKRLATLMILVSGLYGFGNADATIQPPAQSAATNAQSALPAGDGIGFAIDGDAAGVSLIVHLMGLRCPSTIGGFVVAIVVNPINRVQQGWSHPHVIQECHKGRFPSFAHTNPPTAVILERLASWIGTSLDHAGPNPMGRCLGQAVGSGPVSISALGATSAVPVQQMAGLNALDCATIAMAQPKRLASCRVAVKSNHEPSSESLSGKILRAPVQICMIDSSHDRSFKRDWLGPSTAFSRRDGSLYCNQNQKGQIT